MERVALAALIATGAIAAHAQPQSFVERARVQSVQPQYESVQIPRQECSSQWVNEARPVSGETNYGGVVIGGVAGGILGNQVGKGHGREAATAVGAVLGALAGDRLAGNNNQPIQYQQDQREVRSCHTVNEVQNRLTGYRVTYIYGGHEYATFTREQPGNTLPVRVSVMPLEEREFDSSRR